MAFKREDLHAFSRYGTVSSQSLRSTLEEHVYAGKSDVLTFIRWFLLAAGVGFFVSGVIFFFAFNWEALHKFAKIGTLMILTTGFALASVHSGLPELVRRALLAGAAALVGGLFAVFGQVYQTGADAYDFFLGWTVFTLLWVVVSEFPLLWLLFTGLCNVTFSLWMDQVFTGWSLTQSVALQLLFNALVYGGFLLLQTRKPGMVPRWFSELLWISVMAQLTWLYGICLFEFARLEALAAFTAFGAVLAAGYRKAHRMRNLVRIAVLYLAGLTGMIASIVRITNDDSAFGLISLLIVVSMVFLVVHSINLREEWRSHGEA